MRFRPARAAIGALGVLCLTVVLASCTDTPGHVRFDRGGPSAHSVPVGSSDGSLEVDGRLRTFRSYRPANVRTPAPLVIMLPAALETGAQAESSYGWDAEARAGRFVVAYPDGYQRNWNVSDQCCGPPAAQHIDDVAFITALVAHISAAIPIDHARIFATGISAGGMLTYRLACDTKIFAAIGPDSATELNSCPSPAPISIIHVHGRDDRTVPYDGGPGREDAGATSSPGDTDGPPIPALLETWRLVDACAPATISARGAVTTWLTTCTGHRAMELVTITGAGHQWPGQPGPSGPLARQFDPPYLGFDATAAIWTFFAQHPKP